MALTLIKNGTVITMNSARDIVKADILIDGAIIRKIGKIRVPSGSRVRVIDAQGCIVAPGFVQTHIHLCQTLFRNL
ncbi:MAG TPA: N-ethylammeline chlorohydrolase, partial [bacterium]|nr:N-ethylammeline chlorohydrolase [bacterium]